MVTSLTWIQGWLWSDLGSTGTLVSVGEDLWVGLKFDKRVIINLDQVKTLYNYKKTILIIVF